MKHIETAGDGLGHFFDAPLDALKFRVTPIAQNGEELAIATA